MGKKKKLLDFNKLGIPKQFPPVVFPLEDKTYIIRNYFYPEEDLGRVTLHFNKDNCTLYLKDNYEGLHPNWLMSEWSKRGRKVIEGDDASYWLQKRCCPPGRQGIQWILKAHGLTEYNRSVMIAHARGFCDWDELWFEEIK